MVVGPAEAPDRSALERDIAEADAFELDRRLRRALALEAHEPGNLITLCAWHHLRGVHAGVLRCVGTAPDGLRFELGVRAGRPPLAAYGPGEVLVSR